MTSAKVLISLNGVDEFIKTLIMANDFGIVVD
jgi:hypothetical protein